jgi:ubiquinone/menaquinone biosynthesis C-methylase UbiE
VLRRQLPRLHEWRDQVLDRATIGAGDVVLDLGAGTGLIGFGALERVGSDGRVIFTDVSAALLDQCRGTAEELGVSNRCEFAVAPADRLPTAAEAVDVVTARSVIIYLLDKRPAFREAFRVLRPGGRLSIFEPINRYSHPEPADRFHGFDVTPVQHLAAKIAAARTPLDQHPLTNFDERDLVRYAEEAGFDQVNLTYTANTTPWLLETTDWDTFLATALNPLDPTIGEQIAATLTDRERSEFAAHLRPLVEHGAPRKGRSATALLLATR